MRAQVDTPFGIDERFVKTKLCAFHAMGKCARGTKCTFAHASDDVHVPPDLFRTQACRDYLVHGGCRRGEACPYAHGSEDLRPVPLLVVDSVPKASAPSEDSSVVTPVMSATAAAIHMRPQSGSFGSHSLGSVSSRAITEDSGSESLENLDDPFWLIGAKEMPAWSRQSTVQYEEDGPLSEFQEEGEEDEEEEEEDSSAVHFEGDDSFEQKHHSRGKLKKDGLVIDFQEKDRNSQLAVRGPLSERQECTKDDDGALQLVTRNTFLEARPLVVPGARRRNRSAGF
eukprot:CAMPEP_0170606336 /NCGR_PEP_ID=MMETSP0224-20130122/20459_1 /TAXON_ID=285029 /ORGANISM="Togula jolla, Strain CCCM 725" /LENGTH=283 /DNA_ID=CAMNT_0010931413 /DNA_START=79 /DNA_END=930 /DNA_ORIENTATION=+